jgi:type I restriction enzyme S subunit
MEGWIEVTLGEICDFKRGLTYSKKDEVEISSNAVFRANNIDLTTNKIILEEIRYISDTIPIPADKKIRKDDILICTASGSKNHLGKVAIVANDIDMAYGGFMGAIRSKSKIYPRYLFNILISPTFKAHLMALSSGANINNLTFKQIENFKLPLPPLPVQKAIVAKLDAAFASIDIAIAAAERNAENAKQLFQSYLSDVFERGGEGWHKSALGDECKFIDYRGKTPIKTETGMRLITAKNVKKGYINLTPQEFVSPNSYDEWMTRGIPQYGDVLFTTEAPLGHVAQLDTSDKVVVGQRLITLQIKSGNITSTFLKYMLLSSPWQKMLSEKSTGATVQGIKASLLKLIPVLFPSLEEQDLIITRLVEIENMTSQLAEIAIKKKAHLTALKQSLLNQAFSGQLVDA